MTLTHNHYPIIQVGTLPRNNEPGGSRRKFWVLGQDERTEWLLKFPRPGTGEHWAEKIASEIGALIGVDCARVELARWRNNLATICQSFIPAPRDHIATDGPTDLAIGGARIDFLHGWEILETVIPGYDASRRFNQVSHNIKNIVLAIRATTQVESSNPFALSDIVLRHLASYALLDGLIGNTDRHHENWMVMYIRELGNLIALALPSYDHASSLGRELSDERRLQRLQRDDVLAYLYRGRGGVFVGERARPAPSPLKLAQMLCRWKPGFTRDTLDRIDDLEDHQIWVAIDRVPSEFMTETAKRFAYQVVTTSRNELLRGAR